MTDQDDRPALRVDRAFCRRHIIGERVRDSAPLRLSALGLEQRMTLSQSSHRECAVISTTVFCGSSALPLHRIESS